MSTKPAGKKSSSEKSSSEKPHGELPLLDEVHELIEKERLLLSLKVLEQQKEAQEWKAKYDTLVVKVGDTASRTGDFRPLELAAKTSAAETIPSSLTPFATGAAAAAAPSSASSPPSSSSSSSSSSTSSSPSSSAIAPTPEAVQSFISQLRHPWILDLSRKAVRPALLAVLNAEVFTVRGPSIISVARLGHCSMGDDCSAGLGTLASRLGCEALDASFNDLGPSLVAQLNAGLKTRRRTPQYLLLHGNMALSNSPVPLTSTLQVLTDSTWGFSASLADLSHGVLSGLAPGQKRAQEKPSSSSSSAASKAGAKAAPGKAPKADSSAIQDLYDSSKHPLRSLAFLTELLAIVDPEGGTSGRGSKGQAKKGKENARETKEAGRGGGVLRTSKMTMLSFLGLTHAHLSMQSVTKLGEVLRAVAPSLTDLDLSFGYIGLHGARTLRTFLQAPRCQIVRLGLCGNNVGDEGCGALSEGMRGNRTLTALDLRSNNISPAGLRSLCSALMPLGRLVGAGGIMHVVDLRGNPVPQAAALSAQSELRARGSGVLLRSGPALPAELSLGPASSRPASASASGTSSTPGLVLFQHPYQTFAPLQPAADAGPSTASLHSIDLRFASAHYCQHAGHPLCLEWDMRPSGPRAPPLEWIVSVHSPTQDRVLQRQVLSGTSCLPASAGDGSSGAAWTRCRAVMTDLPIKGSLLLRALAPEGTGGGVECSNLVLYSVAPSPLVCIGHDEAAWSSAENAAAAASASLGGSFGCPWSTRLPRGFQVLRAMRAASGGGAGAPMRVEWECKLATRAGQAGGLGGPSGLGSNSLGYEWMVLVAACQGASCVVAARGECFPDPASDAALRPWLWTSLAADIPADLAVLPGDSVLLAARVKSAYEGSVVPLEDGGADGLSVHARSVRLLAPQHGGAGGPSDCTCTTMLVSHNAADWC